MASYGTFTNGPLSPASLTVSLDGGELASSSSGAAAAHLLSTSVASNAVTLVGSPLAQHCIAIPGDTKDGAEPRCLPSTTPGEHTTTFLQLALPRSPITEQHPVLTAPTAAARIPAYDLTRGLLIVFMSLDHARKYLAPQPLLSANRPGAEEDWHGPLPDYQQSLVLFLVRAITHLAAPGFFFLMGVGNVLFVKSRITRGWSTRRLVRHGLVRGAVMVGLAGTVLNDGLMFRGANPSDKHLSNTFLSLGVMFALGACFFLSMLASLAALHLRTRLQGRAAAAVAPILAVLALLVPLMTECVIKWFRASGTDLSTPEALAWMLAFVPDTRAGVQVVYPVLPWLAPTLWGVAYAVAVQGRDRSQMVCWNLRIASAFAAAFTVLRFAESVGNIQLPPTTPPVVVAMHHAHQVAATITAGLIRFLTVVKYPPSLCFLLATLAAVHVILATMSVPRAMAQLPRTSRVLLAFGQSSLFFYLAHVALYFGLGVLAKAIVGPQGLGLLGMTPVWLAGLAGLYPACKWYATFKAGTSQESLWRLF
ncbi:hypothetical protein BC828DRAFT_292992 [Blastocladiella britannica]|nr:hypothetical protein BC828DRAFT_292992 [Blastocladiella britannica]